MPRKSTKSTIFQAAENLIAEIGAEKYSELRYKCQTDLWFLAKDIFKLDLFESTHRPVVNFFLNKKPFDVTKPNYNADNVHQAIKALSEQRRGILLYPRGTYKSSIDAIDILQYIICFPDIRILILVGESSLGEAFVPSIKRHFILEPRMEPTLFQKLFPEFVIDVENDYNKGGEAEYWCPIRKISQVEPTLGSLSVLGSTSGWHCDVLKADDVITDTNSLSETNREKIKTKFIGVINLLDPHGVLELIGTRYHGEDLYEHARKSFTNARYLCAASWIVLPHAKHKKILDLTANDVVLLFPERQGFDYLREKLVLDEPTFRCQQLNDPSRSGPVVNFTLEDLRKATMDPNGWPEKVKRYNFWDLAYGNERVNDYCVGAYVAIDEQFRVYVVHLVVDKFAPGELTFQIAKLARETRPDYVIAENMTGATWLEPEVIKQATAMGFQIPFKLIKMDRTKDAKANRIRSLETLLRSRRLFFSNKIPNMDLVYKQFTDFTGEKRKHIHDDIPDAISFVRQFLPVAGLELPPNNEPGMPPYITNEKNNASWMDLVYGGQNRKISSLLNQQPAAIASPATPKDTRLDDYNWGLNG